MKKVTDSNSHEMKTVVETFIVEETQELIYDNEKLDQWNGYVRQLGLKGQEQIVQPDKSPIPFLHLKKSMEQIFDVLCPCKTEAKDYDISPIPVEILSLMALSEKEGYFHKIEIWYDDKKPDPACVGITGYWYQSNWDEKRNKALDGMKFPTKELCKEAGATASVYSNETGKYLIGKWADVKHSFEELKQMARKRWMENQTNDLKKQIRDCQRKLEDLETEAFEKFN